MNEEERIKEIRQRTEAATPGPWAVGLLLGCVVYAGACNVIDADNGDDAAFVAHSREDIPFLLDLIESLRTQLSESQRREKAAVEDLKLSNTRKFNNPCEICRKRGEKCAPVDLQDVCRLWEWRGPRAEKGEKE